MPNVKLWFCFKALGSRIEVRSRRLLTQRDRPRIIDPERGSMAPSVIIVRQHLPFRSNIYRRNCFSGREVTRGN
jgi:hypothetical protein